MKLYFGNLPSSTTDAQLRELVAAFGTPSSAEVIKDKMTGLARGFAFVEFSNDAEARAAMAALDGKDFGGQMIKVNEARQKSGGSR